MRYPDLIWECLTSSPGSTSNSSSLPVHTMEGSRLHKWLGHCHLHGRLRLSPGLLASAWSSPAYCEHLGSKREMGHSLSLSFPSFASVHLLFSFSLVFQINTLCCNKLLSYYSYKVYVKWNNHLTRHGSHVKILFCAYCKYYTIQKILKSKKL